MSWVIRSLFGSPTADSQAQEINNGEDRAKAPSTANGPERFSRYLLSDEDGEVSPRGTRQSIVAGSSRSERVIRQRKSLPRLDTAAASSTSKRRQANLISMSSGANVVDPAAPKIVLRATNPDPLSSASQKATRNGRIPMASNIFGRLVSKTCASVAKGRRN